MTTYSFSPSDLTFLLQECSRCFYNKVKKVYTRPYQPFPSVFNKIDKAMRDCYHNQSTRLISEDLAKGKIDTSDRRMKSAPIPIVVDDETHHIIISGNMDCLLAYNDGTLGVIDFKTSDTKPEYIDLYSRQLYAYREILQSPHKGYGAIVSNMGLICVFPQAMQLDGAKANLQMSVSWKPVAIDQQWWYLFLVDLVRLLEGEMPPPVEKCFWCELQMARAEKGGAIA